MSESNLIKFFITRDFINDCMNPNKNIYVFGGKFNSPVVNSTYSIDGVQGKLESDYYDPLSNNLQDFIDLWYRVERDSNNTTAITLGGIAGGEILPCNINSDRSAISVKIPWMETLSEQEIGYLTYFTEADPDTPDKDLHGYTDGTINTDFTDKYGRIVEKVAFVFESKINNIGINNSTENVRDSNSYIGIDISKLNIAANILPIRDRVSKESWNSYNDEHLHNLVLTKDDRTGLERSDNKSVLDAKSLKDNTKNQAFNAMNIYYPGVIASMKSIDESDEELTESMGDTLILTNDNRYINNEKDRFNSASEVPINVEKLSGIFYIGEIDEDTGNISGGAIVDGNLTAGPLVLVLNDGTESYLNVANTSATKEYNISDIDPYSL